MNLVQEALKLETPTLSPQNIDGLSRLKSEGNVYKPRRCCCYYIRICNKPQFLPLVSLTYNVSILHNVAEVTIVQEYHNDQEVPADVEYLFGIEPNAAFSKLEVRIGDKTLVGLIKEKQEAKDEYNQGVAQGKTMVYSEQDDDNPDIMRVKLGNLLPSDRLIVEFTYIEQLEVCVNKFWRLTIPTSVRPRYRGKYIPYDQWPKEIRNGIPKENQFTYQFKANVVIQQPSPINFLKSPTHHIEESARSVKGDFVVLTQVTATPGKDFIVLFATEDLHKPIAQLSKYNNDLMQHQKYCASVSFIPEFNDLSLDDAYQAYHEDNMMESDDFSFANQKGYYIFLIDRSGSMQGQRMESAKEALTLFIRSLPVDSYFNIVSFGSTYKFSWPNPKKFNQDSLNSAISEVVSYQGNMNGTEIYQPLKAISEVAKIPGYPMNIFVLTDGAVSSPDQVIHLAKSMKNATVRVYTLGIGSGCSRYLVEKLAIEANGKYEFVADNENLNEKVIYLLQDSITPFLKDVKVELDQLSNCVAIIPNPSTITCVRKNEPLTFFFLFNSDLEGEVNISVSCWDSQVDSLRGFKVGLKVADAADSNSFHKLAAHKLIQSIEKAYRYELETCDILYAKKNVGQKEILEVSIGNQVLSSLSAFICEVKENVQGDALKHFLQQKIKVRVQSQPEELLRDFGGGAKMARKPYAMMQAMSSMSPMSSMSAMQSKRSSAVPMMSKAMAPQLETKSRYKITRMSVKSAVEERSKRQLFDDDDDNEDEEDEQKIINPPQQQQVQSQSSGYQDYNAPSTKPDYKQVIAHQDFTGCFKPSAQLFQCSKIVESKLKSLQPQGLDIDSWITIVVMEWLDTYCANDRQSWTLIYKKAKEYLASKKIRSLDYKDVAQQAIQ